MRALKGKNVTVKDICHYNVTGLICLRLYTPKGCYSNKLLCIMCMGFQRKYNRQSSLSNSNSAKQKYTIQYMYVNYILTCTNELL